MIRAAKIKGLTQRNGGGTVARKMFPFTQVIKCAKACQTYLEDFENLERNSGQCDRLQKSIIKCQALIAFLQKQVGSRIDFTLPGMLPEEFVSIRVLEEKTTIGPLMKSLSDAHQFFKAFTTIRMKNMRDFGENKEVVKFTKKNYFLKNFESISTTLAQNIDSWEEFLKEELGDDEAREQMEAFVTQFIKENLPENLVLGGTISIVSDLKERLRQKNDKKVDWKRIEILLPAVEDINDSLNHKQIESLLQKAHKRKQKRARKSMTFFKKTRRAPVSDGESEPDEEIQFESEVPMASEEIFLRESESQIPVAIEEGMSGVQTFGPFATNPITERYSLAFDFQDAQKMGYFKADFFEFMDEPEKSQIVAKLSSVMEFPAGNKKLRKKLRAPSEAHSYALIYPIGELDLKAPADASDDPEAFDHLLRLVSDGGIVFFSQDSEVIEITNLEPDQPQFAFTGPHTLEPGLEWKLGELEEDNRWVMVQNQEYKDVGAKEMVWLAGGEIPNVENPCMLFRYEDPSVPPSYFTMVTRSRLEIARGQGMNTSYKRLQDALE